MNRNDIKKLLEYYEGRTGGKQIIPDPSGLPLEWYRIGLCHSWEDAMVLAENLIIDRGGWRLPTLGELRGLYRVEAKNNPDLGFIPERGFYCEAWSCESKDKWAAWLLNFSDGNAYLGTKGHAMHRETFLVRGIAVGLKLAPYDDAGKMGMHSLGFCRKFL